MDEIEFKNLVSYITKTGIKLNQKRTLEQSEIKHLTTIRNAIISFSNDYEVEVETESLKGNLDNSKIEYLKKILTSKDFNKNIFYNYYRLELKKITL